MRIWRSPDLLMVQKEAILKMVTMQIYCKSNLTTQSKYLQPEALLVAGLSSRCLFLYFLFCYCFHALTACADEFFVLVAFSNAVEPT